MNLIEIHEDYPVHTHPAPSCSGRAISLTNRNGVPKTSTRGSHVCSIGEPRVMFYESILEKRAQHCAFAYPRAVEVHEQQRLDYMDVSGRPTQHWFDLLLTTSRETIAIAVKPFDVAERGDFRTLLQLIASQTPKDFADRVVLVTERNLPRDVVYNAELIHSVRLDPEPDVDEVVRSQIPPILEPVRIDDLTARCGIGGSAFRSVVRLIAAGEINLAHRCSRIAPTSLITFPVIGDVRS